MPIIQTITASSGGAAGSVTSVAMTVPTGLVVTGSPITTSGTLALTFASGYSIPTDAKQSEWDIAYSNRITSLTTTGNSGASTLIGNTLNIPEYTLAGLGGMANVFTSLGDLVYSNAAGAPVRRSGNITTTTKFLSQTGDGTNSAAPQWTEITASTISAVPLTRQLNINGTAYDLSADRSWSVGTVTSVGLTTSTSGVNIGSTPITTSGNITINIDTASGSANGLLSSTDWTTFNSKMNNPFTSLGDIVYSNAAGAPIRRAGNITTTKMFLSQTGDGTSSAAPQWSTITSSDTGSVPTSRQLTINGTSYDLTADRSWNVGTITSLTGEATASGTGAVSVTLTNSAVIGKVLTGLNLGSGGTIASTDTILQAFGKVQNQISGLVGGVMYQGTWNASANTPTLTSSVGTKGYYYVVNVAGSTNLDGITDWKIGDWVIFNGTTWDKVDNTDAVSSVNGYTGAVSLSTSDIGEGTNLYFTNVRAQNAITLTTSGTSGASTYTSGTLNIPNYSLSGLGGVPSTRQLTINGTAYDLSADRTWSVGTVTSVAALTIGTTGTDITSSVANGTTTPVITLNIPTASSSNRGALSSTDWSTFNAKEPAITAGTTSQYYRGDKTFQTLNTTAVIEATNLYYTDARSRLAISETITGIDYNNTTGVFSITSGYGIPTTAKQTEWDTAYTNRIASLTTTGSSGVATLISNTLNIPNYTAAGLGAVPTSRTITINDVVYDLSANRSWDVGDFGTW